MKQIKLADLPKSELRMIEVCDGPTDCDVGKLHG